MYCLKLLKVAHGSVVVKQIINNPQSHVLCFAISTTAHCCGIHLSSRSVCLNNLLQPRPCLLEICAYLRLVSIS